MIETPHAEFEAGARQGAAKRRVPLFSLYSDTREPTPTMLRDVDTLVIDLQDIGTRIYTYVYTMANCMRAARRHGIKVIVCDRPNPIGGVEIEGITLEPGCESFVGQFPIPTRHGMTIGELARLFNEHFGIGADLEVVAMEGWRRAMYWDDTGLPWVMPSPNIPTLDSAIVFPGTVHIEGTNGIRGTRDDAPVRAGRRAVGASRSSLRRRSTRGSCPACTSVRSSSSRRFRSTRAWRAAAARFTCSIARRSNRCSPGWRVIERAARGRSGELRAGSRRPTNTSTTRARSTSSPDRPSFRAGDRRRRTRRADRRALGGEPSRPSATLQQALPALSLPMAARRPHRRAHGHRSRRRPSACSRRSSIPHDLAVWWQVVRSVTVPRPLGHLRRRVGSHRLPRRAARPARRRVSRHGHGLPAGREFFVADAYWSPPEGDPIGPMALEVRCAPAGRRARDRASVFGRAAKTKDRAGSATFEIVGARAGSGALADLKQLPRERRRRSRTSERDDQTRSDRDPFIKALGLWDVVAMNIVAVVGLRWIARSARRGRAVGVAVDARLARVLHPAGARAHRAVEPPSGAGRHLRLGAPRVRPAARFRRAAGACGSTTSSTSRRCCCLPRRTSRSCSGLRGEGSPTTASIRCVFVLGFLWFCTGHQHHRACRPASGCSTSAASPPGFRRRCSIVCGAIAFATFGSATSFAPSELVPRDDVLTTMSLWSSMCFAFSGFEIASMVGQEVKNPRRTIPLGIIIGRHRRDGHLHPELGVGARRGAGERARRAQRHCRRGRSHHRPARAGRAWARSPDCCWPSASIGGTNSWVAGAARVPFAAGVDAVLPAAFARLHPRYRTPHVALIVQGLAATLLVPRQRVRLARRRADDACRSRTTSW